MASDCDSPRFFAAARNAAIPAGATRTASITRAGGFLTGSGSVTTPRVAAALPYRRQLTTGTWSPCPAST